MGSIMRKLADDHGSSSKDFVLGVVLMAMAASFVLWVPGAIIDGLSGR